MKWAMSALCVLLAGCGEDPAKSVKIAAENSGPVTVAYTSPKGPDRDLLADYCPPEQDAAGPGTLAVTGPCAFRVRQPVHCEVMGDDMIVAVARKARNAATAVFYLNVENYHGPGEYDGAQVFVAVESGQYIYRWSNDEVHATVGPKEAFVRLPVTKLDQEPMHIGCSKLIGPQSNYQYECAASSNGNLQRSPAVQVLSGTIECGR